MKQLKLYVWNEALTATYPGLIAVMAHNVKQARALAEKELAGNTPLKTIKEDLAVRPKVYRKPTAVYAFGCDY